MFFCNTNRYYDLLQEPCEPQFKINRHKGEKHETFNKKFINNFCLSFFIWMRIKATGYTFH